MQLRKPDEQIQPLNSLKLKALNLSAWSSSYIFPIESIYLEDEHLDGINQMIEDWRKETKDFFLTSFKTCKYDGTYRKRISFIEVRWILSNYFSLTEAFKLST